MGYLRQIAGANGCDDQIGVGTFTPQGEDAGKKIGAIGILSDANVTSFKYVNSKDITITVTAKNWLGTALAAADAINGFIPLGRDVTEVVVASGNVRMYYI